MSDGNSLGPSALVAAHAERNATRFDPSRTPLVAELESSSSHNARATAPSPSVSLYREKCSISRQISHISAGLAKSLNMSLSGRSSRSKSEAATRAAFAISEWCPATRARSRNANRNFV